MTYGHCQNTYVISLNSRDKLPLKFSIEEPFILNQVNDFIVSDTLGRALFPFFPHLPWSFMFPSQTKIVLKSTIILLYIIYSLSHCIHKNERVPQPPSLGFWKTYNVPWWEGVDDY